MNYQKVNPEILDNPNNILNLDKYNGRVDIIQPPNTDIVFKMQERNALKNKATSYYEALDYTWEDNLLSRLYFSAENIQILQNGIRAGVFAMSGNKFVVGVPNIDTLKIIMRTTFLQYAEYDLKNVTGEIQRLNEIVFDYAVPATYSEAVGYEKYREDQSTLVMPLERELPHDRNYKQLELKNWV
jgi:hypothetical protein